MTEAIQSFNIPSKGYFIEFLNEPGMQFGHLFCGSHNIKGAVCPNCKKPLLRFTLLDLQDSRLELTDCGFDSLPLLFCWTCNLAQSPFLYQIEKEGGVKLLTYKKRGVYADFPYKNYPTYFPESGLVLREIGEEEQKIIKKNNRSGTEYETLQKYPKLSRPQHQIGGEPFLIQGTREIKCKLCKKAMPLLAAISDEAPKGGHFTGNSFVQVLFHFCKPCSVIGAYQQCD
jgi:hypothetical protein